MYSRDQMSAENSRNPGFKGTFSRGPKGTVQISLQIIDVLDWEQALAKIDLPGHSRQGGDMVIYCFVLISLILSFLPKKSPVLASVLINPAFLFRSCFGVFTVGEKRFEQSDLTALARTEPHCSAACSQEQTTGKTVGPNSHLLQIGRLPAYATV